MTCFLFHSVCSTDSTSVPPVKATNGPISTSGTKPTNPNTMVQTEKNTGATPTGDSSQKTSPMLTPEQTTIAVSTKMTTATMFVVATQPQAPAVTSNLPVQTASTTVAPPVIEGTVGVIGTFPSHKQTTTSIPEPTGNTGTTSTNPSTLNSAGRPTAARTTAGTTSLQTTTSSTTTRSTTTTAPQPKTFLYSLNNGQEKGEEKHLVELCRRLMGNLQDGNCSLTWREHNNKVQFDHVEINGKVKTALAAQYYEEITKAPTDNKTLIAILASCGALLIMIIILAVCASHHRKPYHENQQHLTEELHTVENGYHDNPTLEVMEVQPEMQEKKVALNGEFNDSWIVPIDNLLKEDIPDEEDTHL
ncbi:hypothetical protein PAMP_014776 [Pampus punctatissimus]